MRGSVDRRGRLQTPTPWPTALPCPVAIAAALCLVDPAPAFAYIDPGTGSALVGLVSAGVVSAYFAGRALYYRGVDAVFRVRHRPQRCELAIHCEDPRYEITFLPIVRELSRLGIDPTFFTMYERDDSFEPLPPGVTQRTIAGGMAGYAYLNHLEAKMLVTTTPQVDVMTFRRSKRVKHYCHVPHALGESRYVRPFAYDFFDSVLCCGEILRANIRRIEQIRGFPAKRLLDCGVPHYDELLKQTPTAPLCTGQPVILIGPSWGPHSIFASFGTGIVREVASRYKVIVRPHPQMRISQPAIYQDVLALAGQEGIEVDVSRTPAEAMARADLLISDISGIMHEFAFIQERPVIFLDHTPDTTGLEGELLGGQSELKECCREFIVPLAPSDSGRSLDMIAALLANRSAKRLREVRDQVTYNFGRAGPVAANQIAGLLRCL